VGKPPVSVARHHASMERRTITRALRAIRRRKRWSQRQLGQRIGISQSEMSRRERGSLESCSVPELEQWATALGAHLTLDLRVDGERPLTDARHAAVQNWIVKLLRAAGWIVEAETSFNHYGDRGRIDVLGYHPTLRILLVIEIKSRLDDAQDLLGRLDVKRRIAPKIAAERGWPIAAVVPMIVFREDRSTRRRLSDHQGLFASFELRARAATAWLRHPHQPSPAGIILFVDLHK